MEEQCGPFTESPLFAQQPDLDLRRIQWAKQVKLKDGHKCTEEGCEESNLEMLDAHHIKPRAKFPRKQYLLENGQTLCHLHHALKHTGKARRLILLRALIAEEKR